ncbi:glutathione S-transferase family protein [Shewanella corallii]|uniref:Glutathione S-transferase family protein n=1 Tax=Shewanella corallii TaxID=560080 RepID=A0ABT0NBK2_9GAMM|nr:glutathione S-transferase family protein [Shewanella corallii]MCL2915852.1 glutathione S-transferase family protein [Shewanella corallii]
MITLYGIPRSRSLRISWILEELELDWNYQFIDFAQGDNRNPEFLAISPEGKVPALKDDGLVMTESAAIAYHLAEKYGNGDLLPAPGSDESALHHQWMSFIVTELEQPLWTMGKHKFALPEAYRHREFLGVAVFEFDKAAAIAEGWMPDSAFLLGEEISIADIMLAQTLMWASRFEQKIPPKLSAYMERMSKRASFTAALNKELAGAGKA